MDDEDAELARAAILEAVETQIEEGEPRETSETLERLVAEGYPREEAIRLIGCVLASEMFEIMQQEREYDRARYVQALSRLPHLPWE